MTCSNGELNAQLRGLQARISQVETDIVAHYAGLSQLSLSLAANPFTSASAAASAAIYNFAPVGMNMLRNVMTSLIPKEIMTSIRLMSMLNAQTFFDGTVQLATNLIENTLASGVEMINVILDDVEATVKGEILATLDELYNIDIDIANGIVYPTQQQKINGFWATVNELNNKIYQIENGIISDVDKQLNYFRKDAAKLRLKLKLIEAGVSEDISDALYQARHAGGIIDDINDTLGSVNAVLGSILTTQADIENCMTKSFKIG